MIRNRIVQVGSNGSPGDYSQTRDRVDRVEYRWRERHAAELLGGELGMFVEKRKQGRPGDFATMTMEQVDKRLVELLRARGMSQAEAEAFIQQRPQARPVN